MPFYRFENFKSYRFNPHLSTAEGPVIHVPKGNAYRWIVTKGKSVRYAAVRSLPKLEAAIGKHGAADNWRG